MKDKSIRYKKLIERAKAEYCKRQKLNDKFPMNWYAGCKEINLWTYWQGLGYAENAPDIDVLLVGQDWGNPQSTKIPDTIKNIESINASGLNPANAVQYLDDVDMDRRDEQTDKNLITLFESLGYKDIKNNRYKELFFTNYSLGYRSSGSMSGGMTLSRLLRDKEFFIELVDVLQPKVIICLGRITYQAVLATYGESYDKDKKFVDLVIQQKNKKLVNVGNTRIPVFGMAHCGYFGTLNRGDKPSSKKITGNLSKQLDDWKEIKKVL